MHIRLVRALTTLITSAAVQRFSPLLASAQPGVRAQTTGDAPPTPRPPPPLRLVPFPPPLPVAAPAPDGGGAPAWPSEGTVEAIRVGDEVLLREPCAPWPALAASLRREGSTVHLTLSVVARAHGPLQPAAVAWTEVRGPVDWTGTWSISGAVPSPGGALGWRRAYTLQVGGTYTRTEDPSASREGRWQITRDRAGIVLDGATPVVALARPHTARRAIGPLARTHVQVLMEPRTAGPVVPWSRVDVVSDDAGQVTIAVPANIARLHLGTADLEPHVVTL